MSIILDISGKLRKKSEQSLTSEAWRLGELLAEPSPAVDKILRTKPTEFVITTPEELEQYIFNELFQRTKEEREITPEYILTLQYIAKNISSLGMKEGSPYVNDALLENDYKQAGDNAVFGYLYFVGKRKNPLSREDYLHLAEQCYYRWYDRNHYSIGYMVATHVRGILTKIEHWNTDMMKRVPAFSVISSQNYLQ